MSNIQTQRWLVSRRHFLRGIGACIALPLLDAMAPLRAATGAATVKPRRSVFVYIPNGVNGMTWQVTKPGRDYEFSPSLKPLEKHRADVTVFSGLYHPNGLGAQHVCADTWLTGAKIDSVSARQLPQHRLLRPAHGGGHVPAHTLPVAGAFDHGRHRPAQQYQYPGLFPRWRAAAGGGKSADGL